MFRRSVLPIVALLLVSAASIADEPLERPGEPIYAYDEHTPGQRFMILAGRAYKAGMFESALGHFKAAARWADKFAQYNVGIMHLRGEGTEYDPLQGWAWLELSAERGYPQFQDAADALWAMFNEPERNRARAVLEQDLLPVYGDAQTRERTAREMRFRMRDATGTRTGSRAFMSMLTIIDRTGFPRDADEFYDPDKWNFDTIVDYETRLMRRVAEGEVDVRELELDEN
ncbi:sel1 repeat family protein [Wenzhouxiangella sp. XN79A]|uniref:sel1 repeat family protein n=1 Tax=Wenzhouxiangella sp. XN79A TaxID=2724193 RepID=UPI00144A8E2F|nr:sel1 repeat family protein [Wenzhouxiangella sp. XN79A]NKI33715.1 sel1 repeat family protein [Wenzhouxiangella sp. XN79A]